jgi:hypothetical protein
VGGGEEGERRRVGGVWEEGWEGCGCGRKGEEWEERGMWSGGVVEWWMGW